MCTMCVVQQDVFPIMGMIHMMLTFPVVMTKWKPVPNADVPLSQHFRVFSPTPLQIHVAYMYTPSSRTLELNGAWSLRVALWLRTVAGPFILYQLFTVVHNILFFQPEISSLELKGK